MVKLCELCADSFDSNNAVGSLGSDAGGEYFGNAWFPAEIR